MDHLKPARRAYLPRLPAILKEFSKASFHSKEKTGALADAEKVKELFPHSFGKEIVQAKTGEKLASTPLTIGCVLSGGQAAGGHNVISGLFDALTQLHPDSRLLGFLDGPAGIVEGRHKELTQKEIDPFRNEGGFHLIGSGRTKIETPEQLEASLKTCQALSLDGLVVIGGDDSNTNAAVLAEYFAENGCKTSVVGVPKTIDGDLQNEYVDISFGFDSATKVYSELIGNIGKDALSAKKYTHFIKLMGRSASHIALECALKTRPNLTIIAEEVREKKQTLTGLRDEITDLVCARSKAGKEYGVILIPEGLIEFIPEIKSLIEALNHIIPSHPNDPAKHLDSEAKKTFDTLPKEIQDQLLLERDPHGNVQVSKISTEKLLLLLVKEELKNRKEFKGKFSPVEHFFGYEGRSGYPSNFDANYCYSLGHAAVLLLKEKRSGYMAAISKLSLPTEKWEVHGLPITSLMNIEMRHGRPKPVIQKALVDLEGKAFRSFSSARDDWKIEDAYHSSGPTQFFGDPSITDTIPIIIK